MTRGAAIALALTGLLAVPAIAGAQDGPPFPGFERTEQDLGTWDIVVHGQDRVGRRFRVRAVEVNTPGCDGTCVVTRFEGDLSGDWPSDERLVRPRSDLLTTQLNPASDASPWLATVVTPNGPKGALVDAWDTRLDVEYPASDLRIVTKHGRTASGADVVLLRITGTRRP